MKIKFCGAAESVTGSCHLVSTDKVKVLIDCGQHQGSKAQERMNYELFPFEPSEIDYVILSHAHIDHCGRLPLLVKRGFTGKIYCTDATADLVNIMLRDSAYIHEKEAEWENRKAERAGRPLIEPLYTIQDAEIALEHIEGVLYNQLIQPNDETYFVLNDAGHILGSSIIELWVKEEEAISKMVFSGDIGVQNRPLLRDPVQIKKADYVIMESTYGNRVHENNDISINKLIEIVKKTVERGGTVVIPSFAVGRTQELIFEFGRYYENHPEDKDLLNKIMVYVDSPMATSATEVFTKNAQDFDKETRDYILNGNNPLDFKNLKFTRTTEESKRLNENNEPKVIISASGMAEAGRIRHHLKHHIWDPKSSIVFVGYQAEGTLGRRILDGTKIINLFGDEVYVNAEIHNLEGFSAHADRDGLLDWIGGFKVRPKMIFLVHGEYDSKKDLALLIEEKFGFNVTPVIKIAEYKLHPNNAVEPMNVPEDYMDAEKLVKIRNRISSVHNNLEEILYGAHLLVDDKLSPDRISEINNTVLEIEKNSINLGMILNKNS